MAVVVVLARLVLGGMLLFAAGRKLRDGAEQTTATMSALGFRGPTARPIARMLPWTEIAAGLAILLLGGPWAAVPAAILFVMFTVTVTGNLVQGRHPPCACFGADHTRPIGWGTAVRNAGLTLTAVAIAVIETSSMPLLLAAHAPPMVLAVLALVASAAIVVLVGAHHLALPDEGDAIALPVTDTSPSRSTASTARVGLPLGSRVPDLALPGLDGVEVGLRERLQGQDHVVIFVDPSCGPCGALLTALGQPHEAGLHQSVVVITTESQSLAQTTYAQTPLEVLLDPDRDAARAFRRPATPSGVLVDAEGKVASALAMGPQAVTALVHGDRPAPQSVPPAQPQIVYRSVAGYGVTVRVRGPDPLLRRMDLGDLPGMAEIPDDAVVTEAHEVVDALDVLREVGLPAGSTDADAAELIVGRVELTIAEHASTHVFIHAGAVVIDGVGVLMPGRSHAGKTTLVRAFLERGATYCSDEFALLDPTGRLQPYPRTPRVRAVPHGRGVPAALTGATVCRSAVPIGLILLTHFDHEATFTPVEISAGQAVLGLVENAVAARTNPRAVLDAAAGAAEAAALVMSSRGETEPVVDWVMDRIRIRNALVTDPPRDYSAG